jgi:hypothetical protein
MTEMNVAVEPAAVQRLFLKTTERVTPTIVDALDADNEETFSGIRCPLCSWQPDASSVWCCDCVGTPEPMFEGCGMVWNTFSTRGRCPGCAHQWRWTSCLRCAESSLHEDWYEAAGE